MSGRWLTTAEVAERVHEHVETVRERIRSGAIQARRQGRRPDGTPASRGQLLVEESEVERYLSSLPVVGRAAS